MAIFRSLQKILRNPKTRKPLSSFSPSSNPPLLSRNPNPFLSPPPSSSSSSSSSSSCFLSPLSSLLFRGPHSATPLLLQTDVVFNAKLGLGFRKLHDDHGKKTENNKLTHVGGNFVNLPNFVSFSRMLSGPLLGWMIVNEWYFPAFVGLAVSGATDWLDGYLARRMGINSVVGSYLDPLADKVLIGCVAIAMVENNLLHPGLVGLVVLRDVMLVGGAVYKRASSLHWQWKSWSDFFNLDGTRPEKVEPLFISKVNTVFQLILVAAALLQPEFGTPETQSYVTYLSWLVASTTMASTAAYGVQYLRNKPISIPRGR